MLPGDTPDDSDIISKSEFARRRNVKPPRVTQWINAKQISGDALVGNGRSARIRESVACQQLNKTLDISQRLGNGLATRLAHSERPPTQTSTLPFGDESGALPPPPAQARLTTQDLIAEERLQQLRRQSARERLEDEVRRGRLGDAQAMKATAARQTAQIIAAIDSRLGNAATAIAAEFKLQQRDVLHLIRSEFVKIRGDVAKDLKLNADALPKFASIDLDDATSAALQDSESHFPTLSDGLD